MLPNNQLASAAAATVSVRKTGDVIVPDVRLRIPPLAPRQPKFRFGLRVAEEASS